MDSRMPEGTVTLLERVRRLLVLLVAAAWWYLVEYPAGEALFLSPVSDGVAVTVLAGAAWMRGLAWQDGVLWLMLSRRIHIDAYNNLEALSAIVQVSWAVWAAVWAGASTERARWLLILYHGGLTFDAGMARSFGLGMTVGWEAAPLTLLFLSAAVRRAVLAGNEARFPAGAVPVFMGLFVLAALHRAGPAGHLTCAVTATVAAMILFFGTSPADGEKRGGEGAVLALAGLPLCLAAIQLGAADAPGLEIFLRKRLFAGGLHPNLIGAWSLLMLVIAGSRSAWEIVPASARRVVHAAVVLTYALMLFGAGSRVVLLAGLLVGVTAIAVRGRALVLPRGAPAAGLAAGLALAAWRLGQSASLAEWLINERLFIWSAAWRNIAGALWTGHGVLSYGELPQVIDPDAGVWVYDWIYPHTHHLFLELLLWGGIPLLVCLGMSLCLWWRSSSSWVPRSAMLAIGIVGLADFVHFTPSMVLVVVTVWCLELRPVCAIGPGTGRGWRYPVLLLGGAAMLSVVAGAAASLLFLDARTAVATGDARWRRSLDAAVDAAPLRLDFRLQRMLMRLSFGIRPDRNDLAEAVSLRAARPSYYLVWYIEGRLLELAGEHSDAHAAYVKSLELEPRDPMGIRWARTALTARRLGLDAVIPAWRAVQRGAWGAACILDHPLHGNAFGSLLSDRLRNFRVRTLMELMQAHLAAYHLAVRGISVTEPSRTAVDGTKIPGWLLDSCESVGMMLASNSAGAGRAIASFAPEIPKYGITRLHILGAIADSLGRDDLIDSIAPALRNAWNYRNKNDEDLKLAWLLAGTAGRRNDPEGMLRHLEGLDTRDPMNPWILERKGDALLRLGDAQGARDAYDAALKSVRTARLDPFFARGPREMYTPAGDQWTYVLERAFRRFDDEASAYHARDWDEFGGRLKGRIALCERNMR